MLGVLAVALAVGLVVGIALLAVDFSNLWIPALGERQLRAAQGERTEVVWELAKEEAALAQRERTVEQSLADAGRSIAEATARIEAREAALNIREADLRHQESELEDRLRSVGELERELMRTRAVPSRDDGLDAVDSWWEKQLGTSALGEDVNRPR